jgi:hypothetical protein
MAELMFVRLRETNDWEGESWDWWLQVDGNEDAIAKLREILEVWAPDWGTDDPPFVLHLDNVEPEHVVDKLVQYAAENYFRLHNKVSGRFTCPDDLGENAELLYKGAIRSCFKKDGTDA